ncbi:MAG: IPT/TIG domain-containing protein [Solirubrobacterales bacterium]
MAAALSGVLLALALTIALTGGLGLVIAQGQGGASAGSAVAGASAGTGAGMAIPTAARAQVSAALGAARPAFHVHATPSGALTASNATQGIGASFDASGVTVSKADLELHLSLRSVGFGEGARLQAPPAANPTAQANRATYARGALSEWYANGPAGLEQGFTLKRAPAGTADEPLTLDLALSANAHPTLAANGQGFTLRNGHAELSYGNLLTTDASGRALRTWLALEGGQMLIKVDAAHARYPLSIDPLVQAGSKLTGSDESGEGMLGTSVALSADGSTLLVGGPRDANPKRGAAWVFVREGSSWVQQGSKLTGVEAPSDAGEEEQCAEESPEEAEECAFGSSVALSADGNTALVGEPSATALPGSAWLFTRSGTTWTRSAVLTGSGASGEGRFGKSVALSADGTTALVGDPSASSQRGAAWVFTHGGSGWTVDAALTDAELSHMAHFGRSVALSADGTTALIGGPGDSGYQGAAWVFTRGASSWNQEAGKLTGAEEIGQARFGKSVALSGDGTEALIGGMNDAENHGAVWPFARSGSSFVQQGGKLTGATDNEPHFGYSVALSGDGSVGLVGSPRAETTGLVTVLTRAGSNWQAVSEQLAVSGELGKGWAGASVAVSQDGTTMGVGAPRDNARRGAVWIFTGSPGVTPPLPTVTNVLPGAGEAGITVRVKGENLTGAEAVFFDGHPTTFKVKSQLTIEAVAPEGLTGTVDVTVRTPAGLSALNRPGDEFRYTTGTATGGGTGNPNPVGGPGTGTPGTPGSQTTGGGSKSPSGGVLGATSSAGAACVLTLRNRRLAVTGFRTVALRLQRTGAGACSGRLRLSFNKAKRGKRPKLQTIGTASFAMGSASSKVLKIDLNKAGRKLFAGHGRKLEATLSFVRSVPAPRLARSASVHLRWKRTKKVTLGH